MPQSIDIPPYTSVFSSGMAALMEGVAVELNTASRRTTPSGFVSVFQICSTLVHMSYSTLVQYSCRALRTVTHQSGRLLGVVRSALLVVDGEEVAIRLGHCLRVLEDLQSVVD